MIVRGIEFSAITGPDELNYEFYKESDSRYWARLELRHGKW